MTSPALVVTVRAVAVDVLGPGAEPQVDEVVTGIRVAREGERAAVPRADVGGEADAVVCRLRLLGEDDDLPRAVGVARAQRLDEAVADHAVADDDDGAGGGARRVLGGGGHQAAPSVRAAGADTGSGVEVAVGGRAVGRSGCGSAERSHEQRPSTAPLHEPQPVVARVASATPATVSAPARKAPTMADFVTVLQRQMTAVPGISARLAVSGRAGAGHGATEHERQPIPRDGGAGVVELGQGAGGVADAEEDGADEPVLAQHELGVAAPARVGEGEHLVARVVHVDVDGAHAREVDVVRLEPGQHARALVGRVGVGTGEHVGEDARLVPAGLHEAGHLAAVLGALADGVDVRDRGGEPVVDDDGPVDLEAHGDGEVGARAHPGGDDDEVGGQGRAVAEDDVGGLAVVGRRDAR